MRGTGVAPPGCAATWPFQPIAPVRRRQCATARHVCRASSRHTLSTGVAQTALLRRSAKRVLAAAATGDDLGGDAASGDDSDTDFGASEEDSDMLMSSEEDEDFGDAEADAGEEAMPSDDEGGYISPDAPSALSEAADDEDASILASIGPQRRTPRRTFAAAEEQEEDSKAEEHGDQFDEEEEYWSDGGDYEEGESEDEGPPPPTPEELRADRMEEAEEDRYDNDPEAVEAFRAHAKYQKSDDFKTLDIAAAAKADLTGEEAIQWLDAQTANMPPMQKVNKEDDHFKESNLFNGPFVTDEEFETYDFEDMSRMALGMRPPERTPDRKVWQKGGRETLAESVTVADVDDLLTKGKFLDPTELAETRRIQREAGVEPGRHYRVEKPTRRGPDEFALPEVASPDAAGSGDEAGTGGSDSQALAIQEEQEEGDEVPLMSEELVEDVLDEIGYEAKEQPDNVVEDEYAPFNEYPEPPKREYTFGELLKKAGFDESVLKDYVDVEKVKVTGIQNDVAEVVEGNVFVAESLMEHNGARFLFEAAAKGASMCIAKLAVPGAEQAAMRFTPEDGIAEFVAPEFGLVPKAGLAEDGGKWHRRYGLPGDPEDPDLWPGLGPGEEPSVLSYKDYTPHQRCVMPGDPIPGAAANVPQPPNRFGIGGDDWQERVASGAQASTSGAAGSHNAAGAPSGRVSQIAFGHNADGSLDHTSGFKVPSEEYTRKIVASSPGPTPNVAAEAFGIKQPKSELDTDEGSAALEAQPRRGSDVDTTGLDGDELMKAEALKSVLDALADGHEQAMAEKKEQNARLKWQNNRQQKGGRWMNDPGQVGSAEPDPYWQAAVNDTRICTEAAMRVEEKVQELEAMGQAAGMDENELQELQADAALEIMGPALEYDFSKWNSKTERMDPYDKSLTPHPFNSLIPLESPIPVIFAIDPTDFGAKLAAAFFDWPTRRMQTIVIAGSQGKTSTAWIVRNILEQEHDLVGMACSLEYAIDADKLDLQGRLWRPGDPLKADETKVFSCSRPYSVIEWDPEVKYEVPATTPDAIALQHMAAGMADRGASAAVFECSEWGMVSSRFGATHIDVLAFSELAYDKELPHYLETDLAEVRLRCRHLWNLVDPTRQAAVFCHDDPFLKDYLMACQVPISHTAYTGSKRYDNVLQWMAMEGDVWEGIIPMGMIYKSIHEAPPADEPEELTEEQIAELERQYEESKEYIDATDVGETDDPLMNEDVPVVVQELVLEWKAWKRQLDQMQGYEVPVERLIQTSKEKDRKAWQEAIDQFYEMFDRENHEPITTGLQNRIPVVTYSMVNRNADVYPIEVTYDMFSTSLLIQVASRELEIPAISVETKLIGEQHVRNILAAVATARAKFQTKMGPFAMCQAIANALDVSEAIPGRFETVDLEDSVTMEERRKDGSVVTLPAPLIPYQVIVDSARTPLQLDTLLSTCRELPLCERIILVVGCEGPNPMWGIRREDRPRFGEIAHFGADVVIFTQNNPRQEPPNHIIDDMVQGLPYRVREAYPETEQHYMSDPGRCDSIYERDFLEKQGAQQRHVIEDRWTAIRAAISIARTNDIVVIAGKGAQDYQEYSNYNGDIIRGWFDDRVEARNTLFNLHAAIGTFWGDKIYELSGVITDRLPFKRDEDYEPDDGFSGFDTPGPRKSEGQAGESADTDSLVPA